MNRSMALLLLLAFAVGVAQAQTTKNLVVNGDFSHSKCTSAYCVFKTKNDVEGWVPDPEIEIGNGEIYSDFIKGEKVIELAANGNGCIHQDISNLEAGNYELRFDHACRKGLAFIDCQISASFNGKVLAEYLHKDYTVHNEKFDITLDKVTNSTLKFCSFGGVNNGLGGLLKNVSLIRTTSTASPVVAAGPTPFARGPMPVTFAPDVQLPASPVVAAGPTPFARGPMPVTFAPDVQLHDYILNGNFAKSKCRKSYCLFKQAGDVDGWVPEPEIEVGDGEIYSDFVKGEKVIELAGNSNGCIYQELKDLQPGNYVLGFEHACRKALTFVDCSVSAYFNGKLLAEYVHKDYAVHHETFNLTLDKITTSTVKFCSFGGVSNGAGGILKNVTLMGPASSANAVTLPIQAPVAAAPVVAAPVASAPVNAVATGPLKLTPDEIAKIQNPTATTSVPSTSNQDNLLLHSHSATCMEKTFQFKGGNVVLGFDYKLISSKTVKQSATFVTINGKPIYKALPCDNGGHVKLEGHVEKGDNVIGFCSSGSPVDEHHDIAISHITATEKTIDPTNLIPL